MINAFGLKIHEIKDVLQDEAVETHVRKTLASVLKHLGILDKKSNQIIDECLTRAKSYVYISQYELHTHQILENEGVTREVPKKLTGRSETIYEQIKPYLLSGSVLDLGCGDGKIGVMCAQDGHQVDLIDVYRHPNIDNTGLDFKIFEQATQVPVSDNQYNNTLVLTVFHHSDDPVKTIRESYRVTKPNGRVLIIESVYGVTGEELSEAEREKNKSFFSLNQEQQRMANIFFDHFYNRVIHYSIDPKTKVNVPFNFNTPDNWKEIFENEGFKQEAVIHLGIDQPTAPEYHTLHVLRK